MAECTFQPNVNPLSLTLAQFSYEQIDQSVLEKSGVLNFLVKKYKAH